MLRKRISFIFYLSIILQLLPFNVHSQDKKNEQDIKHNIIKWGVNLTYSIDNYFYAIQPSIELHINKNTFNLSPKFTVNSDIKTTNTINGFDFMYKRFLFPIARPIDFYIISDVGYTILQHTNNQFFIANSNSYASIYQHTLEYKQLEFGVGIIFKYRNIYIDQNIGCGIGQYSENYQLDVPLFTTGSYNEKGTFGIEFAHFYKVGIAYIF